MSKKGKILFFLIFLLAFFFRIYGLNWDQNQHLHPDERFMTMVTETISWPNNLTEYLDASISPLNPHNRGYGFFVYGTFPLFFTKWVAEILKLNNYNNLTLVGRFLSTVFDMGTTVLVFMITLEISKSLSTERKSNIKHNLEMGNMPKWNFIENCKLKIENLPYIAMFFYSCMVLPIQLSHFYAVDTYLTFFITLTFYLLIKVITYHQQQFILTSKFLILNS